MFAERSVGNVYIWNKLFSFISTCAFPEYPRYKFVLSYIAFSVFIFEIVGVSDKVESCHTQPLFIHGIIEKWISASDMGSADNGVMLFADTLTEKVEPEISRHYNDLLAVWAFVIKRSSKVKIICFICCGCAHIFTSVFGFWSYSTTFSHISKGILLHRKSRTNFFQYGFWEIREYFRRYPHISEHTHRKCATWP